jgi:HEAT repeat protein
MLDHDRKKVRLLAVEALGAVGGTEVVPGLILALSDKDKDVRRYAAIFLGRWCAGKEHAVEALESHLLDSSPEVVWHVMSALKTLGKTGYRTRDDVARHLVGKLKHPENREKQYAVHALEMTGNTLACKPLLKALDSPDATASLLDGISQAMGNIGCVGIVPALLKLFSNEKKEQAVRSAAAMALKALGDKRVNDHALPLLDSTTDWLRSLAVKMVGFENNTAAVQKLIAIVEDRKEDTYIRYLAIMSLGKIGDAGAVEPIGKVFSEEDDMLGAAAATALGEIGTVKAESHLIKALDDLSPEVVILAAYHLGKLGSKDALLPVYKLLYRNDVLEFHFCSYQLGSILNVAHNALKAITKEKVQMQVGYNEKSVKKLREFWREKLGLQKPEAPKTGPPP